MNPIRLLKIYRRADKLANLFEEAAVSKSLFTSKMFWFNVLTASASLLGVIPAPPEYVAVAQGLINVALRLVTDTPVHVVTPK
jgi:hypothetical protein